MRPASSHEPGAPAATGGVPLAVPQVGEREWQYLKECIDTGWVSSVGGFVDRFETDLASYVKAEHAVAVVSGTAALHLALITADVRRDDEVIVPSLTFIAPANAVAYVGAVPVFVDVDPQFWQIDPVRVGEFLDTQCELRDDGCFNRVTGRRVRAMLVVDALGHPCDVDALGELAARWRLVLIEDAAEALGASYRNRPVGGGSHVACFSFNGNKTITAGGGGMIVTSDPQIAERARYLSTQAKDDPVAYVHGVVGYNYRLTNIQAAVGCAQLERLDEFVDRKRQIAATYNEWSETVPGVQGMPEAPWARSSFWMYTLLIDAQVVPLGPGELISRLAERDIQARPLWQPLHQSRAHPQKVERPCPVAEDLHARGLSLPCSTALGRDDQDRVMEVLQLALT